MENPKRTTWTELAGWLIFLAAVGPVCFVIWTGVVKIELAKVTPDAWIQAAASIVGSIVSGGVAAGVAYFIFRNEQIAASAREKLQADRRQAEIAKTEQAVEDILNSTLSAVTHSASVVAEYIDDPVKPGVAAVKFEILANNLAAFRVPEPLRVRIANDLPTAAKPIDDFFDAIKKLEKTLREQLLKAPSAANPTAVIIKSAPAAIAAFILYGIHGLSWSSQDIYRCAPNFASLFEAAEDRRRPFIVRLITCARNGQIDIDDDLVRRYLDP